jgi:DNA polymerase III epsilon subunit-like protein
MFNKDLLVLDIESTGIDVTKHEIIQLAAILIDKKTLKEKQTFSSFVKPVSWANRDPEAMAVNGIVWEQLKNAPSIKTVLQKFNRTFGKDCIPTTYGGNLDIIFLPAAYRKAGMKYPFDYHTFNMWPLFYTYMALQKKLTNKKRYVGFSLEDVAEFLEVPPSENRHDALGDCYYEAEILRRLIKELKNKGWTN